LASTWSHHAASPPPLRRERAAQGRELGAKRPLLRFRRHRGGAGGVRLVGELADPRRDRGERRRRDGVDRLAAERRPQLAEQVAAGALGAPLRIDAGELERPFHAGALGDEAEERLHLDRFGVERKKSAGHRLASVGAGADLAPGARAVVEAALEGEQVVAQPLVEVADEARLRQQSAAVAARRLAEQHDAHSREPLGEETEVVEWRRRVERRERHRVFAQPGDPTRVGGGERSGREGERGDGEGEGQSESHRAER
jgi:hypothetical protein